MSSWRQRNADPSLIILLYANAVLNLRADLVAWRPRSTSLVKLTKASLLVLSEVLRNTRSEEADEAAEAVAPGLDPDEVEGALALLEGAGILHDQWRESEAPWLPRTAAVLSPAGEGRAPLAAGLVEKLTVTPNFALRPGPNGLVAWNHHRGRYALLPTEALAVLLEFLRGADAAPKAPALSEEHMPWIQALVDERLLGDFTSLSEANVVPARVSAQAARIQQEMAAGRRALAELGAGAVPMPAAAPRKTPVYCIYGSETPRSRFELPTALGLLVAYAKVYEGGRLLESYDFLPEFFASPAKLRDAVAAHGPGIVLASDYEWSVNANLRMSAALKAAAREHGTFFTVHGGPSVPAYQAACETFLTEHPEVDVAVRGEGEVTTAELLDRLASGGVPALTGVAGITFRDADGSISGSGAPGFVRTADRSRAPDPNIFPSPYLTGVFEESCRQEQIGAAVLETNRGCPYGCTFCDWGAATLQKVTKFDMERVRQEIDWLGQHEIPVLWCADANFGIIERDVEIAEMIAAANARYGFPKHFIVNYAKNATARLARIVRILSDAGVCAQGIISIQSSDEQTLNVIRRSNIKTKQYDELTAIFRDQQLPLSTDLMIGLPGQTVQSFKADLQRFFDKDVPAKAYQTVVLPNSPMADPEYMAKHRIEVDRNKRVVATFSFTREQYDEMMRLYAMHDTFVTWGLLSYVLRYLQWDRGIRAYDFLHELGELMHKSPATVPAITAVATLRARSGPVSLRGWRPVYDEVIWYLRTRYGIEPDSALETAFRVQEAVTRDTGRTVPDTVALSHDFATYFRKRHALLLTDDAGGEALPPLSTYGPAALEVTDPHKLCTLSGRQIQFDSHQAYWELESPLKTLTTRPFFFELA